MYVHMLREYEYLSSVVLEVIFYLFINFTPTFTFTIFYNLVYQLNENQEFE